ncbi:hypothetical protein AB0H83_47335 [Dactylosporangium sp. NPDC050688]|uniref:hypothetical protein n=1 Tax=Dactylosporangium sp. NPDC050688 TaxID=3157217 RepID=UPI0033EB41AA
MSIWDWAPPNSIFRAHLLHVEGQRRSGLLVPPFSNGRDLAVDPAAVEPFLNFQATLHDKQRFLLDESEKLFPFQADNAALAKALRLEYAAGRMGWRDLVDHAASVADQRLNPQQPQPGLNAPTVDPAMGPGLGVAAASMAFAARTRPARDHDPAGRERPQHQDIQQQRDQPVQER